MDRKAWIILTLCGILLAANFYYAAPAPEPTVDSQDQSPATESSAAPVTSPQSPATADAELTVTPYIEPVGENTAELISKQDGKEMVKYTFTSRGGGLQSAELLDHHAVYSKETNVLLNKFAPAPVGAICDAPDRYISLNYDLTVIDNAVYCEATTPSGLRITKRWSLEKSDSKAGAPWLLNLTVTFRNKANTDSVINLEDYSIFTGALSPLYKSEMLQLGGFFFLDNGSLTNKNSSYFNKGFFSKAKPLFQESVENLQFAGVSNQFFTSLVRPSEKYTSTLWAKRQEVTIAGVDPDKPKHAVRLGFSLPARQIAKDESATFTYSIYSGPKEYSILKNMEQDTAKVMNYGWFTIVSVTLNNILNWFHDVVFVKLADHWAWGLSIVALTILIRTVLWPLHNKSSRTMKRMSKLQPIIKDLREKYKDNPNKLNQETMKIYKEYKINPMGGCLPMFLQIPIFFGYFKMLQHAVELRGESFLWVDDLSMPDTIYTIDLPFMLPLLGDALPINLLPIVMAVTMIIQMKISPKAGDPMQQKIMMFMPLMFFFFCYNYAAALALYWATQNIFSIGQIWLSNRLPEPDLQKSDKPKKPGKKSFMERMTEKAEEMQRLKDAQNGKTSAPMRNATPDKAKPKKRTPKTGG